MTNMVQMFHLKTFVKQDKNQIIYIYSLSKDLELSKLIFFNYLVESSSILAHTTVKSG